MAMTSDEVLAIIAQEAGVDPVKLTLDATLIDLDISSLDVVSAVFELEDRFGVEIEPESIAPDWTIGQFVDHVMSLANK